MAEGANPLLDHAWGISPGADRVWAQISGIAPSSRPWERLFVVLQAYMDESYTEGGNFVIAGYIASAEAWAHFSTEWDALLPLMGRRGKNGRFRFKMREMRAHPDNVRAFYRIIEDAALASLSCQINLSDLTKLRNSIMVPGVNIHWGFLNDPYLVTFRLMLDMFHAARFSYADYPFFTLMPQDQPIDFYFDNHVSKRAILSAWDWYMATRSQDIKPFYGATPRFENDEDFLPLQAADFLAWWIRRGYDDQTIDRVRACEFGEWKGRRIIPGGHVTYDEEQMAVIFRHLLREQISVNDVIYRIKFFYNGKRL